MGRPRDHRSPGSEDLPFLGSLHKICERPHHDLHKLAMQHGDIISLRLGLVRAVVVSSTSAARLSSRPMTNVFASRPLTQAGKCLYDRKGLVASRFGYYRRSLRKLCTLQLLSNPRIASFLPMRPRELGLAVEELRMRAGEVVDVSAMVGSLSTGFVCLMVFDRKYGKLKAAIHELVHVSSDFNLADFAPFPGVLDLQGHGRKMKALVEVFDRFFDKIIDEHMKTKGSKKKDESGFVSVLKSNIAEFNQDGEVKLVTTCIYKS